MGKLITIAALVLLSSLTLQAATGGMEIYCTIRSSGENLDCQIVGRDRKTMTSEDINNFIDAAQISGYITLKSRKGLERTYLVDSNSPQYKQFGDVKKSGSMSAVARARTELFAEIEKRVIKVSDELDAKASAAELVLYDPSVTYTKAKMENRAVTAELESFRKNQDKVCTSTPAFEQVSKAKSSLQVTLSNILYAFQTPGTCMADFKIFKNADGSVDLRQLSEVGDKYKTQCKK